MCSSNTNEFLRECQGTALLEADPNRGRSRLNDRERRQAALPIIVFGNDLVSKTNGSVHKEVVSICFFLFYKRECKMLVARNTCASN